MGRLWVTEGGKRRRTAEGIAHELKWKLFSIFLGIFQCPKILDMALPTMALFEPDGYPPRGGFSPLHITNPSHPSAPITSTKRTRIPNILFRGNETKIGSSIVKLVSVDMVDEYPSVFRLPDNSIVYEVGFIAGISTVRKIKPLSFIPIFPYIYVYFCVTNEFIFIIIERSFDILVMHYCLGKDTFIGNRRKRYFAPISPTIIFSGVLSSFYGVFVWHKRTIPRIQISSNRRALI